MIKVKSRGNETAEQMLRQQLEAQRETSLADLSEHLWLLARWFYSNPREGEIFFREKDWPYRRILRACARLLSPKKAETNEAGVPDGKPKSEETK